MNDKYFLDTNILIYSFDGRVPKKKEKTSALIEKALTAHVGLISVQVIQEFFNVALHKFAHPLSLSDAKNYLDQVLIPLCDIFPSPALVREALDLQQTTGYRFYDAQIIASAISGGCKILYTEDMQQGQNISGLKIVNPFE